MTFWYRAEVETIAQRYELDPNLVHAMCLVESSGKTHAHRFEPAFWARYMKDHPRWDGANPERVSSSYGLMQCMYQVAVELGFQDEPEYLFVPIIGLDWGCKKLRSLLDWAERFPASPDHKLQAAIAAYNGGTGGNQPGGLLRNQTYVAKVLNRLQEIRAAHQHTPEADHADQG